MITGAGVKSRERGIADGMEHMPRKALEETTRKTPKSGAVIKNDDSSCFLLVERR